jgi:hypothetical protein
MEETAMDTELLKNRLREKPDLSQLVAEALADPSLIAELLYLVKTDKSSLKFACTKIIRVVSEQEPGLVYNYFDEIAGLIYHENSFIKWDGIIILSNLVCVDSSGKFEGYYQDYFDLIKAPQMITASNVVGNAWKIIISKPHLEGDITKRLLAIPGIVYINKGNPSPECNKIVCGQAIECFEKYFSMSGSQAEIISFVEGQLINSRKKIAKNAKAFLERYSN